MHRDGSVDFLGIGAQRSGTTWLWNVLRSHPGIWMPIQKELHYFDRSLEYRSSPSYLAPERFHQRMFGRGAHHRKFREVLIKGLYRALIQYHNLNDFRWMLRYLFGRVSDGWYLSLFDFGGERVKGEITPNYAILKAADVEHVRALAPSARLIYLLRNPIERTWSQVRFGFTKHQDVPRMRDLEHVKLMAARGASRRSNYLKALGTWRACFPAEQIFIGFFDDIQEKPGDLARDLFSFLGVDPDVPLDPSLLSRRVNASMEVEMPAEVRSILEERFRPEINDLAAQLGGAAARWKADLERGHPL